MLKNLKSEVPWWARLSGALLLALLSVGFTLTPWGNAWELYSYDYLFYLRGERPAPEEIVIVAIDESSFDELNMQWPWPRSVHAALIDSLRKAGAKVVAFDLLFAEPSDPEEDNKLATAIDAFKNVVLGTEINVVYDPQLGFEQVKVVDPVPIIDLTFEEPVLGFVNVDVDPDGFVRSLLPAQSDMNAFSLAAVNTFYGKEVYKPKEDELGALKAWINFYGPSRTIKTVSYYQALDPENFLPPNYLKDKLVFVGFSTSSLATAETNVADHFPAPFSRWVGGYMPGVEIHAQAAGNMISGVFTDQISAWITRWSGFLLAFTAGLMFLCFPPLVGAILCLLLVTALAIGTYSMFANYYTFISPVHVLLPLLVAYFGSPFIHYWFTHKRKAFVRKAFSTYMSPRLVRQLIDQPDLLELGGQELEGTVIFLDLAGFTAFSENFPPKDLIDFLNKNLGVLAEVVLKYQGTIDKYIGDCIMALWGIPIAQEDHAILACSAMIEMRDQVDILAKEAMEESGVKLAVRIGANSGTVVAGNIGGGQRFNYTVLGNEVNLAARIEGINKYFGTNIAISDVTASMLDDRFFLRELDVIRVVGKQEPTKVYEVCGFTDKVSDEKKKLTEFYTKGRQAYAEQRWVEAIEIFQQGLKIFPDDKASINFIERCEAYWKAPPPDDWDGVYQMTSK